MNPNFKIVRAYIFGNVILFFNQIPFLKPIILPLLYALGGVYLEEIECLGKKLKIFVRYRSSDRYVSNQIFKDLEYLPCKEYLHSESEATIVDVGANVGYASLFFATLFPNRTLACVEPDRFNHIMLRLNLKINNIKAKTIHAAVWDKNSRLSTHRDFRDGLDWSISVRENPRGNLLGITIQEIFKRINVTKIDILKIDIEGSEFQVFDGNVDFLDKTKLVLVEIHPEFGDVEQLVSKIRQKGFETTPHAETYFCNKI